MVSSKLAVLLSLTLFTIPALSHNSQNDLHRRNNNRCAPGTYSSSGNSPCTPCPAGSYTKEYGFRNCQQARPGYYIPSRGMTQELPCSPGTYVSSSGATGCLSCPPGFMCPSSAMHTPQQCSPGRYSTGGVANCPLCPAGYFNNIHKATGCCECPAGWFLAHGGNVNCQMCPNQTPYSNPASTSMSQCSAKPGLYAPSKTATQGSNGACPPSLPIPSGIPKRHWTPRSNCKAGERACPVYRGSKVVSFNCVDIRSDLESCGGCVTYSNDGSPSPDGGRDCSAIPFVNDVRCSNGSCQIGSCARGYVISLDGGSCVPPL
ncbi:hypothetical protein CC1G_03282 [Coprinopsis cinerea okayama7|uniref:Tyrosine-protein kinase ephrin type A/B receptor-like domain-containing protein n=1 Tax=Coprinopsis cinerea (strain Okayama-7 / 130 / ATCC MYA-4618 / FGSC 9003) TaxID=240176 RepID=A8N7D9_COPC7|nr:hypothetical protein CC1G_03282 [Coprinopsis cinerea okayama7\|eukprot:XP_001830745.1 hypothetical protein CC1G_03282 [Coprinopsis cinerea okayama7\